MNKTDTAHAITEPIIKQGRQTVNLRKHTNLDGDTSGRVVLLMCLGHAERSAGGLLNRDLDDE